MTVRQAARLLGRSPSTVYRWLRKGHKAPFEQAGLVASKQGRRWVIEKVKEPRMEWHPQVHQETARKYGKTPADFQFEQWPVSNVRLEHVPPPPSDGPSEYSSRYMLALYKCDIPADTPQANQYDADNNPLPDPVGMALARVNIQLRDAETHEVLDEANPSHTNGEVLGALGPQDPHPKARHIELWVRLTPDNPVRVYLAAAPFFYYLKEDGAVMAAYFRGHRGYLKGEEAQSSVHTLSIDWDGNLFIDGEGRPVPPAPPVELPADYQEGQTFGQYIKAKREAAGLNKFAFGSTISQPWKEDKTGEETYDPELWVTWIEDDRAALRLEWNGEVVLNSTQIYGLADALGIDGQHLTNLAELLV